LNIGIDGRILEWKYSGIARYVQLLLSFDALKGATVYFPGKSSITLDPKFKKKIIKTPFKRRELYEQVILPIHLAKDKIDLFIQPYNFGIPWLFRKKSILIVFDIIPLIFKDYFFFARHKKWAHFNYELNTKIALKKATKIVTDSESAKQDLLKYFPKLDEKKITPIYYGFSKVKSDEKENLSKFLISKGIKNDYILAPAGLEERKNAHLLISSLSKFIKSKKIKIQLVFTGFNKVYLEKLKKLVNKLDLSGQVVFTDSVSEIEKNFLFKNAKLIVNPSSFEGFGIPLLEAASFGKPILCSDIPAFQEVGGEYPMYFIKNDEESLKNQLIYFFENETSESNRASSSSEKILARFPISEMEEKWKKLII
jgi:glycosyltransferase involved in cell wall biosynthesis